jgi:hypothetical protein
LPPSQIPFRQGKPKTNLQIDKIIPYFNMPKRQSL